MRVKQNAIEVGTEAGTKEFLGLACIRQHFSLTRTLVAIDDSSERIRELGALLQDRRPVKIVTLFHESDNETVERGYAQKCLEDSESCFPPVESGLGRIVLFFETKEFGVQISESDTSPDIVNKAQSFLLAAKDRVEPGFKDAFEGAFQVLRQLKIKLNLR